MNPFHIAIQARDAGPLPVSFEEAFESLSRLPSLFIEPDGAFVWVSGAEAAVCWQVDGCLFDRNGKLQYIELKGSWTSTAMRAFLESLRLSPDTLVVQHIRNGTFLDAEQFRLTLLKSPP